MTEEPDRTPTGTSPGPTESAMPQKRLKLYSEAIYPLSILLIAIAVAMTVTADFGISVIVAPAYLVSQKFPWLTFGQSEYILQGVLFIIFCVAVRRVRWVYLSSFLTCLIYGVVLDAVQSIPFFDAAVTPPESIPTVARVLLLAGGMILTSFSIALFFQVYLYPQVYDFFVKGVADRYRLNRARFKTGFDLICLVISVVLSLSFFGKPVGIHFGTALMALCNGGLIGLFSKLFDRTIEVVPLFPRFAEKFEI